ncbi:MAG TPA: glycosyltransferase family 1 protein [Candidatus Peribacterales bacterium]|nr:glycosyltransferase family 1 protein [Candidatus Peribacterales bacterium]
MDTREAHSPHPTGKGLFARNVLEELKKRGIAITEYSGGGGLRWHFASARAVRVSSCDLYLSPTSFIVPWLLRKKIKTAIVIHDLIAFESSPHDRKATLIERLLLPRALKTATYIFCVSEATKKELLTKFPEVDNSKISVIYEGSTLPSQPPYLLTPASRSSQRSEGWSLLSNPYILSIGTFSPRKNQLRLIQAFNTLPEELKKETKLILAGGRGWRDAEIIALAKHSPNVEWRGYVPADELTALLANATILAYPSLKEGFGLPVLDAMTLGVPVLTSNMSSMKEIAGDAALLIDPMSVEEITEGLEKLLMESELRREFIERGKGRAKEFSWGKTVDLILKAIEK